MTKREAKRYVCRCAATILGNSGEEGAGWIYEDADVGPDDVPKVEAALAELVDELRRRAGR